MRVPGIAPVSCSLSGLAALVGALIATFLCSAASAQEVTVTSANRKSLALTIYNNGIGLVRESRQVSLDRKPRARIRFEEVSPSILAPSVSLTVSPKPDALKVIEQSYRYDVLNPRTLTEHADGSQLTLLRVHPGSGDIVRVRGESLASFSWGSPVLRTQEGITFYPHQLGIAFDKLPERWSSQPSLNWLVDVRTPGESTLNVAYLTGQMGWSADYVLTLGRSPSDPVSLVGWITLTNNTAMGFPQSHIAVVAGQVHAVTPSSGEYGFEFAEDTDGRFDSKDATKREAVRSTLGEYHLYDLPEKTDLPARSSKQVQFLSTSRLHTRTRYIAEPQGYWEGSSRGATFTTPVDAEIQFDVKESEGLGVPMPQGTVRVFAPDSQARGQLVGQQSIAHTPRDETVKLRVGPAPEVRLTRVLMDRSRMPGRRDDRVQYRLRNSKTVEVSVEVRERDGALLRSSIPATHPDAATTSYEVRVPAGGEVRWDADYREGR
ncbi:MAG: hypothetical protein HY898_33170 [Deltaproteobacteria bacterium]|nr:hypothetical protein [Deltaproteobacteria bacterium]